MMVEGKKGYNHAVDLLADVTVAITGWLAVIEAQRIAINKCIARSEKKVKKEAMEVEKVFVKINDFLLGLDGGDK